MREEEPRPAPGTEWLPRGLISAIYGACAFFKRRPKPAPPETTPVIAPTTSAAKEKTT